VTDATAPEPAQAAGPIEAKTKAGAYAAYAGAFVLFAILTSTATDLSFLPDWVETILYPLVPAIVAFLGSYMKSHEPGKLSLSAIRAARRTI
jgi:drug/metabolite transporter superfamily protein YnfA